MTAIEVISTPSAEWVETVAWATPQYPRAKVDAAGAVLVRSMDITPEYWTEDFGTEYLDALAVINNWRSSHSYPLQVVKMTLWIRAKKIDKGVIVAQRLKRLSSIASKLARNPNMKLSQMQDIGGCRAVLPSVVKLDALAKVYADSIAKNPNAKDRPYLVKKYDYVECPKTDGYRSIHYVYKYGTSSPAHAAHSELRVEIQIRTRLQHAWATAVETVSTFTGQALKSNIGTDEWKRFFVLMGSAIAFREKRPLVPGTPTSRKEVANELRKVATELRVVHVLTSFGNVTQYTSNVSEAAAFLLELDPETVTTKVTGFRKTDLQDANEQYLKAEERIKDKSGAQAVLVSVESLSSLREAFPNYYLDTKVFVQALRQAIAEKSS